MLRSLNDLQRAQAAILADYRDRTSEPASLAVLPRPGIALAHGVYGRVDAVVTSDPDYGAHLLVVRRQWTGTPPTAENSQAASIRCYPLPNHTVDNYSVNEYVRIVAAHGAMIAEALP